MAVVTKNALIAKFAAGKYQTAADYVDLVDTLYSSNAIETFTTSSSMFSQSKPLGAIEIFVNSTSSVAEVTMPSVTTNSNDQHEQSIAVSEYGATAFVKVDNVNNYWMPLGLPIQQGGPAGDNQGS